MRLYLTRDKNGLFALWNGKKGLKKIDGIWDKYDWVKSRNEISPIATMEIDAARRHFHKIISKGTMARVERMTLG